MEKDPHVHTSDLQSLKKHYTKATVEGKTVFTFKGQRLLTTYAKYLIEYLETLQPNTMKLITKEIEKAFEKQGYTGDLYPEEIKIICKLFNPVGVGTWYLYENEGNGIFQCFANLNDPEMAECGAVSLHELESLELPFGLKIERDLSFPIGKHTLKHIIDTIKGGGHI